LWILAWISLGAVLALVYVGIQTEIYRISYSVHEKKRVLRHTQDAFERMQMRVLRMKALDALEEKIQAAEMDLALPTEVKVLKVEMAESPASAARLDSGRTLFSIFQWVRDAHATVVAPEKD
jgi:hypothetical protein